MEPMHNIAQQTDSTLMTTDTATVTSHYHQKQDESQQHQKAQSSENVNIAESTIQTLHELLSLPASMELSQIELIYRAEGNANLVLTLPQFKKVLRLPKSAITSSDEAQEKEKDTNLTMKDFTAYMQIFQQLLGSAFILDADICWIYQDADRKWINKHISSARPPHRLDKEFCGQFGLLLPDATQLPMLLPLPSMKTKTEILHFNLQPKEKLNKDTTTTTTTTCDTYAIEIKPKQGWLLLPNTETSSSNIETSHVDVNDLFDIRRPTTAPTSPTSIAAKKAKTTDARCRYCAMQFLKFKNGKISKLSEYCPIELFSGVPSRMLAALNALFRCPQNNLRVFKNGILIYGDHASSISYKQLCDEIFPGDNFQLVKNLLVECLLRDYSNRSDTIEVLTPTDSSVEVIVGQPHTSVKAKVEDCKDQAMKTEKIKSEMEQTETETKASNSKQTQETRAIAVEMLTATVERNTATTTTQAKINVAEMQCLPKNCILKKILHLQLLVKKNLTLMHQAGYTNYSRKSYNALNTLLKKTMHVSLDNLSPFEQYLLGATALDCSIMIAFQRIPAIKDELSNTQIIKVANTESFFMTKVTLLDLDPKPDSHFAKYIKQTKEAYSAIYES